MCICIIMSLHYMMCLSATPARMQKVPFVKATPKPFITPVSRVFHMCLTYNLPHWSCWVLASWQLHYLLGNGTALHSQTIFYTVFWIHKQSLVADMLHLRGWQCRSGLLLFFLSCTRLWIWHTHTQNNIHILMCMFMSSPCLGIVLASSFQARLGLSDPSFCLSFPIPSVLT